MNNYVLADPIIASCNDQTLIRPRNQRSILVSPTSRRMEPNFLQTDCRDIQSTPNFGPGCVRYHLQVKFIPLLQIKARPTRDPPSQQYQPSIFDSVPARRLAARPPCPRITSFPRAPAATVPNSRVLASPILTWMVIVQTIYLGQGGCPSWEKSLRQLRVHLSGLAESGWIRRDNQPKPSAAETTRLADAIKMLPKHCGILRCHIIYTTQRLDTSFAEEIGAFTPGGRIDDQPLIAVAQNEHLGGAITDTGQAFRERTFSPFFEISAFKAR